MQLNCQIFRGFSVPVQAYLFRYLLILQCKQIEDADHLAVRVPCINTFGVSGPSPSIIIKVHTIS